MTSEQVLALIDAEISARFAGGTVDEWREGAHQVRHTPLDKLLAMKAEYENRVVQESGAAVIVREVNLP